MIGGEPVVAVDEEEIPSDGNNQDGVQRCSLVLQRPRQHSDVFLTVPSPRALIPPLEDFIRDVDVLQREFGGDRRVAGLRRFGAAALDLAWVAAGRPVHGVPSDRVEASSLHGGSSGRIRTMQVIRASVSVSPERPASDAAASPITAVA